MKLALCVLGLLLSGALADAQENPSEVIVMPTPVPTATPEPLEESEDAWFSRHLEGDLPFTFHLLFSGGYQRLALGPLNTRLQAQGYDAAPEDFLSFGGSLQFSAWDVLTEFEGHVGTTLPVVNQDYWMAMSASQVFFNVGYQLRPVKQLRIYPIAGLGLAVMDLNFTRRTVLPTFDEFLTAPTRRGGLSHTAFALNLGVGLDWHWGWLGKVGLRAGMIWTPFAGAWSTSSTPNDQINSNAPIASGPDLRPQGPYLRLNIGF